MQNTIREGHLIPYFDHGDNLITTLKNSSKRRNISLLKFAYRKLKNIFLYRWSYMCPFNGKRIKWNRMRGVTIGKHVYIGQRCSIDNAYPEYIYIEDNVSLAGGVVVLAHTNPYVHFKNVIESSVAPVVIKEGAWIGEGAIILRGVTVGKYSIVSAGTIVDRNIPDYSIAQGNPMKIIANIENLINV